MAYSALGLGEKFFKNWSDFVAISHHYCDSGSTKGFYLSKKYNYLLCGWHTSSDMPLTSVPTSSPSCQGVDVLIEIAPGHSPIANVQEWSDTADCILIRIRDLADFEVKGGRQIRIWPTAGAAQKDIEIFLLGTVWGALCHQRGILPLHASAIVTGGVITAFAGHSGAGKSTTAALMSSLDYELIADDILPVSFNQSSVPGAWPYLRLLKLRRDSIRELDLTPMEFVSERFEKERYFVRPKSVADDKWRKLERIYLLDIDSKVSGVTIDQLTGGEAVRAIVDQTYRLSWLLDSRKFGEHLAFSTRLASKVAIYRLRRSPSLSTGAALKSAICAHLDDRQT
jgi:hypothetical protein